MTSSRLARSCTRIIDRYQASPVAHKAEGGCRFDPSCCTYMREAFATRRFLTAWLLSTWRVIRCNPLTRPRSVDPLVRARRFAPRPRAGAGRTVFASLLLAGVVTMLIGSVAGAQTIQGPCTGTVNGRHPATMTRGNPLVVREGQNVTVNGTLQGANADTKSVTNIQVDIISGLISAKEVRQGNGPNWGGSVNVDAYLKKGKGLYRVHGTASAPGISCRGDGYIQLDGAGLIAAVATGVGVVGGIGTLTSPGISRSSVTMADLGADLDRDIKRPVSGLDAPASPDAAGWQGYPAGRESFVIRRAGVGSCCLVTALALPLMMVGMAGEVPTRGPVSGTALSSRRVWKRGHTILGFFSGLLLGLGGTVVLQQQAVWVLDIWTAIVLPVGLAILVAVRARIGRPYIIEETVA